MLIDIARSFLVVDQAVPIADLPADRQAISTSCGREFGAHLGRDGLLEKRMIVLLGPARFWAGFAAVRARQPGVSLAVERREGLLGPEGVESSLIGVVARTLWMMPLLTRISWHPVTSSVRSPRDAVARWTATT